MGGSKGKQEYKSGVSYTTVVLPWENKPLIYICKWCHSLYSYNITTIDYGLAFVSNLQGELLVEVSCLTLSLYPNGCMNTRK